MTKYTHHIPRLTFVLFLAMSFVAINSASAFAQYRGAYPGHEEKKGEELEIIVPQIFSSQVSSTEQAKKLDVVYDELYVALWNFAISDFNFQKQLYELLMNERFQTTRYGAEFSGILKSAMTNLNENHKKLKKTIEDAETDFKYVRERMRMADKEVLDTVWAEKIAEYKKVSNQYFKMEYKFLKSYRTLVEFILKQGGGYYYNSGDQTLKFYKLGAYDFYGKAVDKLHGISYEQAKLLKSHAPANMDPDLLK